MGRPNFPIIIVQTHISSSIQTSMAATNMFEPGWILIGFIEDRLGDTKHFTPARIRTHSHLIWDAKFPYILQSDNKFFSISNFHGGYIYVWAGLNPDWFHWGSSRGIQNKSIRPGSNQFPFSMGRQTSYNLCSDTKFFFNLKLPWRLQICLSRAESWFGFIEDRLGDTKQFNPARLRPIPIFYGTPNFPIFSVQTINSSPSQTSMAATYMFEPGWILIGFIDDRLGDSNNSIKPGSEPIPIFYGTPNFPIIIVQTQNFLQLKLPWRLQICLSRAESWLVSLRIV